MSCLGAGGAVAAGVSYAATQFGLPADMAAIGALVAWVTFVAWLVSRRERRSRDK